MSPSQTILDLAELMGPVFCWGERVVMHSDSLTLNTKGITRSIYSYIHARACVLHNRAEIDPSFTFTCIDPTWIHDLNTINTVMGLIPTILL